MVDGATNYILDLFSETYADLVERMAERQREVFMAIAREGRTTGLTGQAFIKRYHLQSASAVTAAIRGLLDKDFITHDKGAYMVYDPFFALWLRRQ